MVSASYHLPTPADVFLKYLILNLGMSPGFQPADYKNLQFPAKMYIDYVRVYQRAGTKGAVTCNPSTRPTQDYINEYVFCPSSKSPTHPLQPSRGLHKSQLDNMVSGWIRLPSEFQVSWLLKIRRSFVITLAFYSQHYLYRDVSAEAQDELCIMTCYTT